jgi:hypothetical protein
MPVDEGRVLNGYWCIAQWECESGLAAGFVVG